MNKILFISSIGMFMNNIYFIIISDKQLKWLYLLGIITSILNHGFNDYTKNQLRILDRTVNLYRFILY